MENTQSKKQLFLEIIRFLIVGGIATILDYATTFLFGVILKDYWFNTAVSNTIGHIIGLLVNYFLSIIFVYKQVKDKKQGKTFKAFMLFVLVDVVGLLVTIGFMSLQEAYFPVINISLFGYDFNVVWLLSKIFMTLVCLIWNYIGRKKFIFK